MKTNNQVDSTELYYATDSLVKAGYNAYMDLARFDGHIDFVGTAHRIATQFLQWANRSVDFDAGSKGVWAYELHEQFGRAAIKQLSLEETTLTDEECRRVYSELKDVPPLIAHEIARQLLKEVAQAREESAPKPTQTAPYTSTELHHAACVRLTLDSLKTFCAEARGGSVEEIMKMSFQEAVHLLAPNGLSFSYSSPLCIGDWNPTIKILETAQQIREGKL